MKYVFCGLLVAASAFGQNFSGKEALDDAIDQAIRQDQIPGAVLVIGHNGRIAWGLTSLEPDVQDLFLEETDPKDGRRYFHGGVWRTFESRRETIRVRGGRDVVFEVRSSVHGPLVTDALEGARTLGSPAVALRWTGLDPSDTTAEALAALKPQYQEVFLLREEGSGTRAAVEELFEVAGMPLKVGMLLGHVEAIKRAVAANLGVSVLSALAVKREAQYGTLTILNVEQFPIQRRWYIARLAEHPLIASADVFIKFLHEYKQKSV